MTRLGGLGIPGTGAIEQTTEYELFWGGDRGKGLVLEQSAKYSGAMRDAGNTPTTVIRGGLLMGKVTSSDELEEWDADASDGTQDLYGVCPYELRAQDFDANNADRAAGVIVEAPLKASSLLIQGTVMTSHADEFLARRALHEMGCTLDDDPQGYKAGAGGRILAVSGTTQTITEAQNGTTFVYTGTGGVAVTLPTLHPGLKYTLLRGANSGDDYSITSAAGTDIIGGNSVGLSSITWTTTGEMIGNLVVIEGIYVGTTPKWLVTVPPTPLGTGLTGAQAYAIA